MSECKTCKYWLKITNTKESYGVCSWFQFNSIPCMPGWVAVATDYGAISPTYSGCPVHEDAEA